MTMQRDEEAQRELDEARRIASTTADELTARDIERMARSDVAVERIAAAIVLQGRTRIPGALRPLLPLIRLLVQDPAARWQALIAVAQGISDEPEAVWDVVAEFGGADDQDERDGVACVLLEHLLDEHFDDYYARVRERALTDKSFSQMLSMCWVDEAGGKREQLRDLVRLVRSKNENRASGNLP